MELTNALRDALNNFAAIEEDIESQQRRIAEAISRRNELEKAVRAADGWTETPDRFVFACRLFDDEKMRLRSEPIECL